MLTIRSALSADFTLESRASWRRRLLGIPADEVTFARRGFKTSGSDTQERLEQIGLTFLHGYHASLNHSDPNVLALRLDAVEHELRGFAYEGAAMGLGLLDELSPWNRNRHKTFLRDTGVSHAYMIHVGFGWVIARVPWLSFSVERAIAHLDPLLRWLAVDGYGFSTLYFRGPKYLLRPRRLTSLHGYARHAFAQGLGRALWFLAGAEVGSIARTVNDLPTSMHADVWSGVGLAATYAGGVNCEALDRLRVSAGIYEAQLAQGAAFAAKTRERAGNVSRHTETACQVLCGMTCSAAARITDVALHRLPADEGVPAYEIWRRRIQAQFS